FFSFFLFFFIDTSTPEIYTLSLHDALPIFNAVAPTNYLLTNPLALRKFIDSRGESLLKGWRNMLADLQAGNVRMTDPDGFRVGEDRKSTRLNSSHVKISYAVFCLKKKKIKA